MPHSVPLFLALLSIVMAITSVLYRTPRNFIFKVVLFVLEKIIFLFTTKPFRKKVSKELKYKLTDQFHNEIKILTKENRELEAHIKNLERDRDRWKNSFYTQKETSDNNYWDGMKHGFNLSEKKSAKDDKKKSKKKLAERHLFALKEISKGNNIIGYSISYLEDNGYIKSVQNDTELHYEITELGKKHLDKYMEEEPVPIL